MSDRTAWLARTVETAIEPDLLICDPHHHLWEYPTSRYLLDEALADFGGGHRVAKTVYVECRQRYRTFGDETLRPVGETEFVEQIVSEREVTSDGEIQVAAGIVGFADLTLGDSVQPVLEAHLGASKRFRGIRHASAWDASDKIHNAHTNPPQDLLQSRKFRQGFACLDRLGLTFDAWLYHPQLPELAELASEFPGVSIILNHVGGPLGIGPYAGKRDEVFALWKNHMADLARCENVFVKLGGLTLTSAGFGWHKRETPPGSPELAEAMGPYYLTCIEYFGAQRCMFESNFPVDRASCSYTVLWNAFKRLSCDFSKAERAALFHDTAAKVYGLA